MLFSGTDQDIIKDFTEAFQEAAKRLDNADCAKLYGGQEAALNALYGASYASSALGKPVYESSFTSNPYWNLSNIIDTCCGNNRAACEVLLLPVCLLKDSETLSFPT